MEMGAPRVLAVLTGRIAPLGADSGTSGIAKLPRSGPVPLGDHGLEGDEQADRRHHGGPDKAVLFYAAIRHWLVAVPAPSEVHYAAAQAKGRERYERFLETLSRRLSKGPTLLREVSVDIARAEDGPPESEGSDAN